MQIYVASSCWREKAAAKALCCISNWQKSLRKPHPSDNMHLHLFPSESTNQHSHGTGQAAFTRSEIMHITHRLKVHLLGTYLKFCMLNSLLIGEKSKISSEKLKFI